MSYFRRYRGCVVAQSLRIKRLKHSPWEVVQLRSQKNSSICYTLPPRESDAVAAGEGFLPVSPSPAVQTSDPREGG